MLMRLFVSGVAGDTKPGDVIEEPQAMRVEEVVNKLEGVRLVGRHPQWVEGARRVTIDLAADSPVERPVSDQDTIIDTFRNAFDALAKQQMDDDVAEAERFDYAFDVGTKTFTLNLPTGLVRLAVLDNVRAKLIQTDREKGKGKGTGRGKGRRGAGKVTPPNSVGEPVEAPADESTP